MGDHVVFFFGAGISKPTFDSAPTFDFEGSQVEEITQKVLEAPLIFTEHKRYAFPSSVKANPNIGQPRDSSEEHVGKVQEFINTVRQHAQTVLSQCGRQVTYEDLYALCGEVVSDQEETKSAEAPVNPAIRHFSNALRCEAADFLLHDNDNPLFHTANEATFLISGVVRELLSQSPDEIQGLDLLRKAIHELDRVTVVTLNHDLLLEQFLEVNNIDFDDGFRKVDNGVEQYSPELLFDGSADVTVIKPHGSINWYYDRDERDHFSFSSIPPNPGEEIFSLLPEPSILSGYRKEGNYTEGIFGDMVDAFLQALHDTNTVIESGFGWTDNGMYNHLHRYLDWNEQNQLLLLHRKKDFQPSVESPGFLHPLANSFRYSPENLIRSLPRYLNHTSWAEIKTHIERS